MRFLQRNIIFIILILAGTGYFVFLKKKPCEVPIQYRIGTFDTKFGISQKDFLSAMDTASAIWEKSIGRNLFEYNVKGDLIVNLKYDSRQQITQENAVLKADVAKTNQLASSIKQQFIVLQDTLKIAEQDYRDAVAQFNQHQSDYNSEVEHWNNIGGAPKSEFNKLNEEKSSLREEYNALENKRTDVNNLVAQINAFINKYNLLVRDANSTIGTINKTAGKEFEEGLYDPNTNEIDIFQYDSKQKLIRVLAHELGHAIGLEHNDNPLSIMYALNQADNEVLSKDDVMALKARCEI